MKFLECDCFGTDTHLEHMDFKYLWKFLVLYLGVMQMQHIALSASALVCRLKYPHE